MVAQIVVAHTVHVVHAIVVVVVVIVVVAHYEAVNDFNNVSLFVFVSLSLSL